MHAAVVFRYDSYIFTTGSAPCSVDVTAHGTRANVPCTYTHLDFQAAGRQSRRWLQARWGTKRNIERAKEFLQGCNIDRLGGCSTSFNMLIQPGVRLNETSGLGLISHCTQCRTAAAFARLLLREEVASGCGQRLHSGHVWIHLLRACASK